MLHTLLTIHMMNVRREEKYRRYIVFECIDDYTRNTYIKCLLYKKYKGKLNAILALVYLPVLKFLLDKDDNLKVDSNNNHGTTFFSISFEIIMVWFVQISIWNIF